MIQVFHFSEAGGHAENEDAFAVRPLDGEPPGHVGAVADGQGGRAGGAVAARVACQAVADAALGYARAKLLLPATWTRILQQADAAVADNPAAGFTTLVAFGLTESYVCGGSCGDSAAALLNANQPGVILTARQHKDPPVGSRAATFMPFATRLIRPWTLLAVSDGVWKYVGWESVLRVALEQRGDGLLAALRERARLRGSGGLQDDFTLVVFTDPAV